MTSPPLNSCRQGKAATVASYAKPANEEPGPALQLPAGPRLQILARTEQPSLLQPLHQREMEFF
jgi:hypothetical protein